MLSSCNAYLFSSHPFDRLAVVMKLGLAGAVYPNRSALPMCAAMFIAILIFGPTW